MRKKLKYNKYGVSAKSERTYNNIVFDSKKEMKRYKELLLLEKAGDISDLILQPSFELQPSFQSQYGKKIRAINYVADFQYYSVSSDCWVVEDVKGVKTKEYLIKKKMFMYQYSHIIFRET